MKIKTLIKIAAIALLGLSLSSATASAQQPHNSISGYGNFYDGMDPYVPAGAIVGWYAYAYGNSQATIEIGGVYMLQTSAPPNGSTSGSGPVSGAGGVSVRIWGQSYGGASGASVTVYW